MVKAMKWSEIKQTIDNIGLSLSSCLAICGMDENQTVGNMVIDLEKAFKPDGEGYKYLTVAENGVLALCNYMFEDGKINVTKDLLKIQKRAKDIYKLCHGEDTLYCAMACNKIITIIDTFLNEWQTGKESGKNETVEQAGNTPTPKRGGQTKPFSCKMINDTDGTKLKKIHDVIKGKNGKDAILVILASIELGWLLRPYYTQFQSEFKDVEKCSKSMYNAYIKKENNKYPNEEIEGMKTALKE